MENTENAGTVAAKWSVGDVVYLPYKYCRCGCGSMAIIEAKVTAINVTDEGATYVVGTSKKCLEIKDCKQMYKTAGDAANAVAASKDERERKKAEESGKEEEREEKIGEEIVVAIKEAFEKIGKALDEK